jgi:GNAT superfamily N-acetyltransferase
MPESIVQLRAADFDDAMDFLNLVFSAHAPHDFARLLPTLYRPTDEHMGYNYAVRKDGRIRAIVGLFPIAWQVGSVRLRVGGIGGVSTHPRYRNSGLMRALMEHCVRTMREQGYHVSWLGGQRQRYAYYGYERCGCEVAADLGKANLRHCFPDSAPLRLEELGSQDAERLARARQLHDRQPVHCLRPPEDFYLHCTNWYHRPYAAMAEDGRMVGYLVANPKGGYVTELLADTDALALDAARAWVERHCENGAGIDLPPFSGELLHHLGRICNSVTTRASGNWQVFDWPTVTDALLRVRHADRPMPDGRVVLGIGGQARLLLEVAGAEARCQATDQSPDLECPAPEAHRLLFGPLPPSLVRPLPRRAAVLDAWCPLPLFWRRQDGV